MQNGGIVVIYQVSKGESRKETETTPPTKATTLIIRYRLEKGSIMANTMTNINALQQAIEFMTMNNGNADVISKLEKMLASAEKKRAAAKNAPRTKSAETRKNEEKAREVAQVIAAHGEPVTADWLTEQHLGFLTTNAANGCMRTALRLGLVRKVDKVRDGGRTLVRYEAVTEEQEG